MLSRPHAIQYAKELVDAYDAFSQELNEQSSGSGNYLSHLHLFDRVCARRQLALHTGYKESIPVVLPTYRLLRHHAQRNPKDTAKEISNANKAFFETLYAGR
jgi:hypothetical protein